MAFRVVKTTDDQHLGEVFEFVEAGNVITFADGDVVPIDEVFEDRHGNVIAVGTTYQMTLQKESKE